MRRNKWTPPPTFTAPVDPEEFKFCCGLMSAAYSGRMPVDPTKEVVLLEDDETEETQEIRFTDTPFNRAMHAIRAHYWETRPEEKQDEFMSMMYRLNCFGHFVRLCIKRNDPRIAPFVQMKDGELSAIDDVLLEAAATVKVGGRGFARKEMFAKARELAEKQRQADAQPE